MMRKSILLIALGKHFFVTYFVFRANWIVFLIKKKLGLNPAQTEKSLNPEIIISMTSYPARFKFARKSIKSLLMQKGVNFKIILVLHTDDMTHENYFKDLKSEFNLVIEPYEQDLKSFLKIIPTLQKHPRSIVISADDDMYYRGSWLSELLSGHFKNPHAILGHRGLRVKYDSNKKMAPYVTWRQELEPQIDSEILLTSVGGILYPPGVFNQLVFNMELAMRLTPSNDDFWIYFVARELRIPQGIVHSNNLNPYYWLSSQKTALWKSNVNGNMNDEQIKKLSEHFGS